MKKKLLIAVLLLAVTFLGVKARVFAGNGPSDEYSYVSFYDSNAQDSSATKVIYEPNTVHNDAFAGATYDKATNTLTLNNLKTNLSLALNEMGEDFKVNLVGENEISYIICYGFGYGGNIEFVGDGSLVINKDKSKERGVTMAAEGTVGRFTVDSTATVKVYGSKEAVKVLYSKEADGSKVIVLKNGQDISKNVVSGQQVETVPKQMNVISLQNSGNSEYKVATKDGKKYTVSGVEPYYVSSQTIVQVGNEYIYDPWSNPTGANDSTFNTLEDLEAAGYTLTDEDVVITSYATNFGNYPLAKSANGTEYVYMHMYDQNMQESYKVFSLTQTKVTLADGNEYILMTENNDVQFDSLTEIYEDVVEDGYYSHTVNVTDFEVLPGSAIVPEVVTASDNKSDNDKAAATAVNILLEAAKNGEEVVGMSAELISAINEAVQNGDDVTVELDTTKMELKDVSDEVKDKVEAKIKEEKTLKDSNVLGYFDINLIVKINGDALDEKVTDLKEEMEVKLDVSELVKNLPAVASGKVRQYNVITIHNGEVKVLKGTLNSDNTLSFKTNGFSSYVVTYNDVDADSVNPKTLDNIGSYLAVLVLSIIGFATTLYLKKRHN